MNKRLKMLYWLSGSVNRYFQGYALSDWLSVGRREYGGRNGLIPNVSLSPAVLFEKKLAQNSIRVVHQNPCHHVVEA